MIIVILIVLGLCFGSFVNAWVWRLHEQAGLNKSRKLKGKSKNIVSQKDLSILRGRSMCVHCKHELAWYDLVPVISWVSLGGKCRYCRKPISWQYPIVELATATLFVLSYTYFPYQLTTTSYQLLFILWLVSLLWFMAMIVYDLRWMLLPDKLTYSLLGLAVAQVLLLGFVKEDGGVIIQAIGGLLSVGGIFYLLFQISDGTWIGGGDVKLGFGIGLLAGSIAHGFMLVFFASVLGTLVTLPLLVLQRKRALKKQIPFGPFLIAATVVVYLFGASITAYYQRMFLGI